MGTSNKPGGCQNCLELPTQCKTQIVCIVTVTIFIAIFNSLWFKTRNCLIDLSIFFAIQGISRRLVKAALQKAAKKREMRYSDLKKIDRGVRRHFHDDITVVVVFIDPHSINRSLLHTPPISIRGGGTVPAPANS